MTGEDLSGKARKSALRYLGYRDRSVHEMRNYLEGKGYSAPVVDGTVEYLASLGYLNDARFARTFAQYRIECKKMGRFRLRHELVNRGIAESLADSVLDEVFADISELDLARDCAEKKLRAWEGLPIQTVKRRLAGFLGRKGFNAETVYRTVNELIT